MTKDGRFWAGLSRVSRGVALTVAALLLVPPSGAHANETSRWTDRVDAPKKVDIRTVIIEKSSSRVTVTAHIRNLTKKGEFRFRAQWYEDITRVSVKRVNGRVQVKSRNFYVGAPPGGQKCRGTKVKWKTKADRIKVSIPVRCAGLVTAHPGVDVKATLGKKKDRARFRDWYSSFEKKNRTLPRGAQALNKVLRAVKAEDFSSVRHGEVDREAWEFLLQTLGGQTTYATDCFFEDGGYTANCAIEDENGDLAAVYALLYWEPSFSPSGWALWNAYYDF